MAQGNSDPPLPQFFAQEECGFARAENCFAGGLGAKQSEVFVSLPLPERNNGRRCVGYRALIRIAPDANLALYSKH
jgi:hypothetical protein